MPYLFDQLDLNHDGVIDFNEALGVYKIFGCTDENYRVSNQIKMIIITGFPYHFFGANQRKVNIKILLWIQCAVSKDWRDWHILAGNKENCVTKLESLNALSELNSYIHLIKKLTQVFNNQIYNTEFHHSS